MLLEEKIDLDALYTSHDKAYMSPVEVESGDFVVIRIRTKKDNVSKVFLVTGDLRLRMRKEKSEGLFDFYSYRLRVRETTNYYFILEKGEEILRYNRLGVSDNTDPQLEFSIIPGFHIPSWINGALMYQIFIDRFYNGDPSNDVNDGEYIYLGRPVERVPWDSPVKAFDVHRFYGGDLQGVYEKLDYLKSLKVEAIYFNPLFVSPSNHKYDTQDYSHIDPHIGKIVNGAEDYLGRTTDERNLTASDRLFSDLVRECHRRGIRVIIDGVFNHCGSFSKWFNKSGYYTEKMGYEKGAYEDKDSPYRTYFSFEDNSDSAWPGNESYDKWWGNETLPKLNYEESPLLEEEILNIARKWVSEPFSADGWRLDVAADLGHSEEYNHNFWKKFRKAVKEANPEAVILAEHYGNPYNYLRGDEWDTVMNYDAFMEPVSYFLTGIEKHSDRSEMNLKGDGNAFFRSMVLNMAHMPENSILSSMNQLSNHDHSRFMTRTNHFVGRLKDGLNDADINVSKPVFRLGVMIQMTWPGAPTIYYGDETGMTGWTDPDSRRPFNWDSPDLELIEYHKYLTGIRNRNPVFRNGSLVLITAGFEHCVYARVWENSVGIVAINTSEYEIVLDIPVWKTGITDNDILTRRMFSYEYGYNAGQTKRQSEGGFLKSRLQPYGGKIYTGKIGSLA